MIIRIPFQGIQETKKQQPEILSFLSISVYNAGDGDSGIAFKEI